MRFLKKVNIFSRKTGFVINDIKNTLSREYKPIIFSVVVKGQFSRELVDNLHSTITAGLRGYLKDTELEVSGVLTKNSFIIMVEIDKSLSQEIVGFIEQCDAIFDKSFDNLLKPRYLLEVESDKNNKRKLARQIQQ